MVKVTIRRLQGLERVRHRNPPKPWAWAAGVRAPLRYPKRLPGGGRRRKTACWLSGRNGTRKSPFFRPGRMRLRWGPQFRIRLQSESDRCSEGQSSQACLDRITPAADEGVRPTVLGGAVTRSEERRVGKEC